MTDTMEIVHKEWTDGGEFQLRRGEEKLGELRYSVDDGFVSLDHTRVHTSLRGQGRARELLDAALAWLFANEKSFVARCPYVRAQFEQDPALEQYL